MKELGKRNQVSDVADFVESNVPQDEVPSKIQGSLGIGVLGLGERHWNGGRTFARAEAKYQGGPSAADRMDL